VGVTAGVDGGTEDACGRVVFLSFFFLSFFLSFSLTNMGLRSYEGVLISP
jgi:hypothetical protein